jgi:tRNA pseudouridine-54 N-methylase
MKSLKLLILLFAVYCLLFTRLALASREMEDYLYQSEKYREVYDEFVVSRDKYLKHKILTVKEGAIAATKKLILQRHQVLRTYLLALKQKLKTTPGVIEGQAEEVLSSQLDKKIIWLEEQSEETEKLSSASLDDLFVLSDRVEEKEEELKNLAYSSLSEMILGKIRSLQQESVALASFLKDEVFEKKEATEAAQLDLWLREVSVKNYLAQKEIEAAEINLWNLKAAREEAEMVKHFNNLKIDVDDAKIYLNQAVSFQKEIFSELNHD